MTVEEFVNEYNQTSDKEKCIKKHILHDKYVPYAEKITRCKNIVDSTMYIEVDNKKIFKQNSPSQYILLNLELIGLYTDIEIDIANSINEFDELEKCKSTNLIINMLPAYEKNSWDMLLTMITNDLMENTRSLIGYIDNKIDVLSMLNSFISDLDAENVGNE